MYLFVYGTLKRGHRNHHYLEDQEYIGEFETKPYYRLFECPSFPMMIKDKKKGYSICGELYEIDDEDVLIDELDIHEALYERKQIKLIDFEEPVCTYIYIASLAGCTECYSIWG